MTREEMIAERDRLLHGDPPFTLDPLGKMTRKDGIPGLLERRQYGDYDVNASGVRLALESQLQAWQHLIDRMRKP